MDATKLTISQKLDLLLQDRFPEKKPKAKSEKEVWAAYYRRELLKNKKR